MPKPAAAAALLACLVWLCLPPLCTVSESEFGGPGGACRAGLSPVDGHRPPAAAHGSFHPCPPQYDCPGAPHASLPCNLISHLQLFAAPPAAAGCTDTQAPLATAAPAATAAEASSSARSGARSGAVPTAAPALRHHSRNPGAAAVGLEGHKAMGHKPPAGCHRGGPRCARMQQHTASCCRAGHTPSSPFLWQCYALTLAPPPTCLAACRSDCRAPHCHCHSRVCD